MTSENHYSTLRIYNWVNNVTRWRDRRDHQGVQYNKINEIIDAISELILLSEDRIKYQDGVIDKDLVTAPGSPNAGDRYIVAGLGGGWSGFNINDIVEYDGASWSNVTPAEGYMVWVEDENLFYYFNGTSWGVLIPHPVVETDGGTGQTTYTKGDILYSDATNSLAKLGIGKKLLSLNVNAAGDLPAYANPITRSLKNQVMYYEDFESYTNADSMQGLIFYEDPATSGNTYTVSNNFAHEGSNAYRILRTNDTGGDDTYRILHDFLYPHPITIGSITKISGYIYFDDLDGSSLAAGACFGINSHIKFYDSSATGFSVTGRPSFVFGYNSLLGVRVYDGTTWHNLGINVVLDEWHKFEIFYRLLDWQVATPVEYYVRWIDDADGTPVSYTDGWRAITDLATSDRFFELSGLNFEGDWKSVDAYMDEIKVERLAWDATP